MDLRGGGMEVKGYLGHEPYEPYFANHKIFFSLIECRRNMIDNYYNENALSAGTKISDSRASWSKSEIKSYAVQ